MQIGAAVVCWFMLDHKAWDDGIKGRKLAGRSAMCGLPAVFVFGSEAFPPPMHSAAVLE